MAIDLQKLTADQLRTLIVNCEKRGEVELAALAFKRLCAIQPAAATDEGLPADDPIRLAFWQAMYAAEEIRTRANGRTTRLSRTREKAKRDGIVATMEAMALKPAPSEGFAILTEGGHPEFTYEFIIAAHPDRFSAAAVTASRKRLHDKNIDLPEAAG